MTSCVTKASNAVQNKFHNMFYAWGLFIAKRPKKVIASSFLIALLCSIRLIIAPRQPLPSETRQEKLFAPQDSQGFEDYERYQDTFGYSSRRNSVYITTQPHGGNVLTATILAEAQRFDHVIREELYMYSYKDGGWYDQPNNLSFTDLCVRANGSPCLNNQNPLELFMYSNGSYRFSFTDSEILDIVNSRRGIDPILFPSGGKTINVDAVFGGIVRDSSGRIISAASLRLDYQLQNGDQNGETYKRAFGWEEQLNYFCAPAWTNNPPDSRGNAYPDEYVAWQSTVVDVYPNTQSAISREGSNSVRGDVVSLQIGFICIVLYCLLILTRCRSPVTSRANLAIMGIASCGMAIAIAYSIGALIRPVNQVVNVLPFIILGIGVDDMFVLINSLEQVSKDLPVEERIAKSVAHAGVSITITSLTDFLAFLLGASSSLPGLSSFCIFAAIGIMADFFLQISFFLGWLVLDARREARGRADCWCNPCFPKKEESGCCTFYPQLEHLNLKYYVPLFRNKHFKILVLVAFPAFSGIAAWQASKLQQNFDRRWFVDGDAQLQQAFYISDIYYTNTGADGIPINIVTPSTAKFDYTSIASQRKLLDLSVVVAQNQWIETESVFPWYEPLRAWVYPCISTHTIASGGSSSSCVGSACVVNGALLYPYCTSKRFQRNANGELLRDASGEPISTGTDNKTMVLADGSTAPIDTPINATYLPPAFFYQYLDQFLFDAPAGRRYGSYFKWTVANNGNLSSAEVDQGLHAAQFRATSLYLNQATDQVDSMRSLRADVESVGIGEDNDSYPYTFIYIFYEQFAIIASEALTNLALALTAVTIITILMIGSVQAALYIVLCVIMVDVDILGLMYMWGLTIDSVTIINLVLAVGLAVDYSSHVAHAFVVATGTRQERVEKAVAAMGTAVVHGAASTFAAVLVLSSSQSYIFRVFFKQFFGICIFGAAHGLCFLPVLLSFIGPESVKIDEPASKAKPQDQEAVAIPKADIMVPVTPATPSMEAGRG